jgi:hypothetical protein
VAVPYELTLEPDLDRGGSRYRAALNGEIEPAAVRRLSDWLALAMQNPAASFVIDLSETMRTSARARLELRALLRRHNGLVEERRLYVVAPPRARRRALSAGSASAALLLESVLGAGGSAPVPL